MGIGKFFKKTIRGDPFSKQRQFEKLAQKEAKKQRQIDAGVQSFRFNRFGNKKLNKKDLAEIQKFKKTLTNPPKKKSFDSVINDFIPNPENVGKVNMDFGMGPKKKSGRSSLDDLASF